MARPRTVTKEDSLERALLLFWEHGYDRTSIADLSAAIGVGPSSIYNTFGSKEALFEQAIGRYVGTYADPALQHIGNDRGEGVVEFVRGLMQILVKLYTDKKLPPGCAVFQSGGAGMPSNSSACAVTNGIKGVLVKAVRTRLEGRVAAGEELASPPKILAHFIVATLRGISQLASDGASRADLMKVGEHAAQSCAARS